MFLPKAKEERLKEKPVIHVGDRIDRSAQHNIYSVLGLVEKVPNELSKYLWSLWQEFTYEAAKADLDLLIEHKIPTIMTVGFGDEVLEFVNRTREEVNYRLEQPDVRPFHEVAYHDFSPNHPNPVESRRFRAYVGELLHQCYLMLQKENKAVDLMGGATILDGAKILLGMEVRPTIRNLLRFDEDVIAAADFPQFEVQKGELIYPKGMALVCDTRLFDFEKEHEFFMLGFLKFVLKVQYATLGNLLDKAGLERSFYFNDPRTDKYVEFWATIIANRFPID